MISNINKDEDLSTLVEENDPRTTGIRKALISIGNGVIILPSEVLPGDFIQYWYKNNDSIWLGHSAILENVEQSDSSVQCRLYGSHRSLGGVGVSQYKVNISDPGKKVYLVRYIP